MAEGQVKRNRIVLSPGLAAAPWAILDGFSWPAPPLARRAGQAILAGIAWETGRAPPGWNGLARRLARLARTADTPRRPI